LFDSAGENNFDQLLNNCIVSDKYKRPSMETGFHSLLRKYVIHVHPVYLTVLLCLNQSRVAIAELFPNLDYEYIPYVHPGFALYDAIKSSDITQKVFFLENHGVIISSDSNKEALDILATLNKTAENYLRNSKHWNKFDISYADLAPNKTNYLFPDAAIFLGDDVKVETRAAHNYVELFCLGLDEARYISQEDVHHLKNLEAEKYRKTV
jgi:rhamnose utilization protein RhaD (predicted bifunctional aldolase and dehydrogenase)